MRKFDRTSTIRVYVREKVCAVGVDVVGGVEGKFSVSFGPSPSDLDQAEQKQSPMSLFLGTVLILGRCPCFRTCIKHLVPYPETFEQ